MNIHDLRPVSQLNKRFGVKAVVYGPPGSGKTPLIGTAPRPVTLMVEPGTLSVRNQHFPAYEANTKEKIEDFFKWVLQSTEARAFDTIVIDSISEIAEVYLRWAEKKNSHGLKAYGDMAEGVYNLCNDLYYAPNKHIVLIGKQMSVDEGGMQKRKPYFPGKELNTKIPHMYDEVLYLSHAQIVGIPQPVRAIRTKETFDIMARDRSGMLAELEPPDLTALFVKAMS